VQNQHLDVRVRLVDNAFDAPGQHLLGDAQDAPVQLPEPGRFAEPM
nr:hypothetical protein [Tanacetum cinerariifolium]